MKRYTRNRLIGALCAGALLATPFGAMAATTPTAAGQTVGNTATVNYKVGGVAQALIESSKDGNSTSGAGNGSATTFIVDDMLSLTVQKVDTDITSVGPGEKVTLTYKVTNNGNAAQGAILTTFDGALANDPFSTAGTHTSFNAPSPAIHVDKAGTNNGALGAEDTADSIDSIAVGESATVFVTFTVSANALNDDLAVLGLRAQVAATGASYGNVGAVVSQTSTTADWDPTTEQYVFAGASNDATGSGDADYDGKASALNAALVTVTSDTGTGGGGAGSMKVTKTVAVVSDPTGNTTNPKAIPGAVMKYTITVANSGASNATNVSVEDDINTEVQNGYIAYKTDSMTATANGTAFTTCSDDATDSDGCAWDGTNNKVTVGNLSVDAGKSAVVTFEVTIK